MVRKASSNLALQRQDRQERPKARDHESRFYLLTFLTKSAKTSLTKSPSNNRLLREKRQSASWYKCDNAFYAESTSNHSVQVYMHVRKCNTSMGQEWQGHRTTYKEPEGPHEGGNWVDGRKGHRMLPRTEDQGSKPRWSQLKYQLSLAKPWSFPKPIQVVLIPLIWKCYQTCLYIFKIANLTTEWQHCYRG